MANTTNPHLLNETIYSVFVRSHTPEGTFAALQKDLPRIRDLGTGIIWLMPIHPIGKAQRKGSLGSPYAIADYRAVNPEYGTLADFKHLVDEIHALGMRCIIDVVYNHTSPDSWLAQNHPEWFYKTPQGAMGNRTADWTDVVDLDYAHAALREHQIETLEQWAAIVDGFRCDVASLVPLDFWLEARRRVETVRPGCIWLAESVEPSFIEENRRRGFVAHTDAELYEAFDLCYDYDIYGEFEAYVTGRLPLADYLAAIRRQDELYPAGYLKLRFLENHDRLRIHSLVPDEGRLRALTCFLYLLRGTTLVYGGQEVGGTHTPSLFDHDPVDWMVQTDLRPLMTRLAAIRRNAVLREGAFVLEAAGADNVVLRYTGGGQCLEAALNLAGKTPAAALDAPDGEYENLLGGGPVHLQEGRLQNAEGPVVIVYGTERQGA